MSKSKIIFLFPILFIAFFINLLLYSYGQEENSPSLYSVKFYTGDYKIRQEKAMEDGALCYVEQHFNATENPDNNYTLVLVTDNANEMSRLWGQYYVDRISEEFQIEKGKDNGISVIKDGDRGYGNMKYLNIPAILLEPFYISNSLGLEWAETEQGKLAQIIVESIYKFFPDGGLIAFSVGHKYKTSRPDDCGAMPFEGIKEIDFNEKVMEKAARMLDPDCVLLSETYFPGLFDEICNIIENNFYNKEFIDKEFKNIKEKYENKIKECKYKNEFDIIIRDMLGELKASHTGYYTVYAPEYYHLSGIFQNTEEIKNLFKDKEVLYPSIGIFTKEIEGKIFIISVLHGGVAEKGGLLRGDEIVSIDGNPFMPVKSFLDKKEVTIKVKRNENGEPFEVKLEPEMINPVEEFLRAERESIRVFEIEGKKIGYIHIWSFAGIEYYEEFLEGITEGELKEADSLIFDLRDGWGGASPEYLNVFNKNVPVLHMIDREGQINTWDSQWRKPVVMLVNGRTRSGKEILAFGFKKYNIGKVMGEKTAGATLGGKIFVASDNSILYLACMDTKIDGEDLEGKGVEPDIEIPVDIKYCEGKDLQIEKAMDELVKNEQ